MIDYTYLNWKFYDKLYCTEVIETSLVKKTIEKLKILEDRYGTDRIVPISEIFWIDKDISIPEIRKFLEKSVIECNLESSELSLCYKILGKTLRNGDQIFQEITEIADSIIQGEGNYDHLKVLDEFLKNPYRGTSVLEVRAIMAARQALASSQRNPEKDEYSYGVPKKVKDLLEELNIDTSGVPQETLDLSLHIYVDDGMGYGAQNGDVLEIDSPKNGELRIWM